MYNDLEKLEEDINELIKNVMSRNENIQIELKAALSDKSIQIPKGFAKDAEHKAIKLSGELSAYEKIIKIIANRQKGY